MMGCFVIWKMLQSLYPGILKHEGKQIGKIADNLVALYEAIDHWMHIETASRMVFNPKTATLLTGVSNRVTLKKHNDT
jgi:hypothetical protein